MIEKVSETALLVAWHRAQESALFNDPLAARLAGDRGRELAASVGSGDALSFALTMRTVAIDRLILKAISQGVETVVNLGAGLDTRPYRMALPPTLQWIEVDHPTIVEYKSTQLASETPSCRVERIAADLARYRLPDVKKALVVTEGVIPYLTNDQASRLSRDLFAAPGVVSWIQDYRRGRLNQRAEARLRLPFRFDVLDPLPFFSRDGWVVRENVGILDVADGVKRRAPLPFPWNALRAVAPGLVRRKGNETYGYAMLAKS
jgi:methyltransferase (TIGR00027 family)